MSAKQPRRPSLAQIMRDLRAAAEERGDSGVYALSHGATLRMRQRDTADDEGRAVCRRQLIIARHGAPVGVIETATFLGHGHIPAYAVGVCYPSDAGGWWRVAYTWDVSLQPFEVLPLPL